MWRICGEGRKETMISRYVYYSKLFGRGEIFPSWYEFGSKGIFSLFLLIVGLLSFPSHTSLHTACIPHLPIFLLPILILIELLHFFRVLGVSNCRQFMSATLMPISFCSLVGQPQIFFYAPLDAGPIQTLTALLSDAFTLPVCGKVTRFTPFFQYTPGGVDDDV